MGKPDVRYYANCENQLERGTWVQQDISSSGRPIMLATDCHVILSPGDLVCKLGDHRLLKVRKVYPLSGAVMSSNDRWYGDYGIRLSDGTSVQNIAHLYIPGS